MDYEYEDELDRMRARRHGKKTAQPSGTYRKEKKSSLPKSKKHRKKKLLLLETVLLIFVLLSAYFLLGHKTFKEGYWTIAVFGVDSRDGNLGKGALSDVIMICNIDKKTGEIKLVSVYRDTYSKIDREGTYHKLNEAYFKGGYEQAVTALNDNLDLHIDDYATFNWKSVAQAINILDGIDLEITEKEFEYINSFITETVESTGIGSHHLEHAGLNHLDGVQAVAYARLRLMDTDFNRTERQRKVVNLALEKAKQSNFSVLYNILVTVLPQVKTSIGIDDLVPIAKGIKNYHIGETAGFPFSRTTMKINKRDYVIPTTLKSNVIELHKFLYGEDNYTPSSTVKEISKKISEVSGIYEPGEKTPSGGNGGGEKVKSTKPVEAVTEPVEETENLTEPASTEETPEETEEESSGESESTEHPTDESGKLIGPGAEIETTPAPESQNVQDNLPRESSGEREQDENGSTGGENTEKQTEPLSAESDTMSRPDTEISGPGQN